MIDYKKLKRFYKNKRVFVTGHTGFKGSWLCAVLMELGADVYGYSLAPSSKCSLFNIIKLEEGMHSIIGDIRDYNVLEKAYIKAEPEIVFHLAAQPIVRESYVIPRYTYETNVMGTVNILDCMRCHSGVSSFLNVTTDKVYENNDLFNHEFVEDEKLDGYDPYSNSKSCSELVTHSYKKSFFDSEDSASSSQILKISTARAGNVIGGGDFAADRIIPDCVRASIKGESIIVRNPYSIRPYQHVLEPISAYLEIAMKQVDQSDIAGAYNVGPREDDCINTGNIADLFVSYWGDGANWKNICELNPTHEATYLKLSCKKIMDKIEWTPHWHIDKAVEETVIWYKAWNNGEEMRDITKQQIFGYFCTDYFSH